MRGIKNKLNLIFVVMLAMVCLVGCSGKEYVVTTAFQKNELMRINGKSCYLPEMMLYLTTVQNQYEEVYGSEIWQRTPGGASIESQIKEMVLAKVAQVKVMNLMAESYNLTLSEAEKQAVSKRAEEFYNGLNDVERAKIGVTEADVENAYTEYALSNKLYEYVIRDINPEISDDEARTVTILHILIKTYTEDGQGNITRLGEHGIAEAREKAQTVWELAKSGESSFEALASKYSDDDELTYSFGHSDAGGGSVEEAAFLLGTGEISDIIETDTGFHIIKCVSSFDIEQTQANKATILKARKDSVFNETYEAFLGTLTKILNEKLYESIALIHDENVTTSDFFDVDF